MSCSCWYRVINLIRQRIIAILRGSGAHLFRSALPSVYGSSHSGCVIWMCVLERYMKCLSPGQARAAARQLHLASGDMLRSPTV